eukprot:364379-Chlamydomonas_euryale.AAC.9
MSGTDAGVGGSLAGVVVSECCTDSQPAATAGWRWWRGGPYRVDRAAKGATPATMNKPAEGQGAEVFVRASLSRWARAWKVVCSSAAGTGVIVRPVLHAGCHLHQSARSPMQPTPPLHGRATRVATCTDIQFHPFKPPSCMPPTCMLLLPAPPLRMHAQPLAQKCMRTTHAVFPPIPCMHAQPLAPKCMRTTHAVFPPIPCMHA